MIFTFNQTTSFCFSAITFKLVCLTRSNTISLHISLEDLENISFPLLKSPIDQQFAFSNLILGKVCYP